jgi:hypothetical protein
MPTAATKSSTAANTNVRQQIISKTPRIKRKRLNNKQKNIVETIIGIFYSTSLSGSELEPV